VQFPAPVHFRALVAAWLEASRAMADIITGEFIAKYTNDLVEAAANGRGEELKDLLAAKNNRKRINECDAAAGLAPVHVAVKHCRYEILGILLDNGGSVNIPIGHLPRSTPLHLAVNTRDAQRMGKHNRWMLLCQCMLIGCFWGCMLFLASRLTFSEFSAGVITVDMCHISCESAC
jgi:hypothetical protein